MKLRMRQPGCKPSTMKWIYHQHSMSITKRQSSDCPEFVEGRVKPLVFRQAQHERECEKLANIMQESIKLVIIGQLEEVREKQEQEFFKRALPECQLRNPGQNPRKKDD